MTTSRLNNLNSQNRKSNLYNSYSPTFFLSDLKYPLNISPIEKLNMEFYNYNISLSPYKEEESLRKNLINEMKEIICNLLNNESDKTGITYEIFSFGSSDYGLFLPSSDIDILILPKSENSTIVTSNKVLGILAAHFKKKPDFIDPTYIIHLHKARVPVLKVKTQLYGIEFDIIVNKAESLYQSNYIKEELRKKPYLKLFCLFLKSFLKSRNLHDSHVGGLCSYAQFLLLLHFFEIHPLIQRKMIDPLMNMGVLFLDFLQYFGSDFPYEGVTICNKSYEHCKNQNIINTIQNKNYISSLKLKRNLKIDDMIFYRKQTSSAIISLEDPVDCKHDVGDNCSNFYAIKEVFHHAYRIMTIALSYKIDKYHSLISLWLKHDSNAEKWRKDIIEKFKQSNFKNKRTF